MKQLLMNLQDKNYSQFIGVVKETYIDLESFKNVSKSKLLKNETQQ